MGKQNWRAKRSQAPSRLTAQASSLSWRTSPLTAHRKISFAARSRPSFGTWPRSTGLPASSVHLVGETTLVRSEDASGLRGHGRQCPRRLHRSKGAGQGRRPAPIRRPARQGTVEQAEVASQLDLHRRQRVQPVAGRQAGRRDRPPRRQCRDLGRQARSPADAASPYQRFPSMGSYSAEDREDSSPRSAPASAACCAMRSIEQMARGSPGLTGACAGLAQASLPASGRRAVRGRLRAGGYVWAPGGARAGYFALETGSKKRPRNCAKPTRSSEPRSGC